MRAAARRRARFFSSFNSHDEILRMTN
jgi:hypothetical protein